jgi:hypothetical protein
VVFWPPTTGKAKAFVFQEASFSKSSALRVKDAFGPKPFLSQKPVWPQNLPLGQDPILVTDVQLNLQNNGTLNVVFQDKSGSDATQRSCQLGLESTLLHGLLHLIDQALQHANWRMETPPNTPASQDKGMEVARTARPAYTH